MQNPLRNLPSVNQLLDSPPLRKLVDSANHNVVVGGVRSFLDQLRHQVTNSAGEFSIPQPIELAEKIARWIEKNNQPKLCPVINATGVILHTGLGRAPLAHSAIEAIREIAPGYCSLELDLESGERGQRVECVEQLLCQLTGAEAATVVNNNAAATMIVLGALGGGGEIIVSRGQLIEIGGSYRLPDVMECSGTRLREVGTTNKTHLSDYENAIHDETRALMKVHPSNFAVVGFTKSVSLKELVQLGHRRGLPVIDDIGSGALVDFSQYGVAEEPLSSHSIKLGADVVMFSGDKLVGGPQCGMIVGKKKYIEKVMKHPMMRAIRVGKLTLSALVATLQLYLDPKQAELKIPVLQMLSTPEENLKLRSQKIADQLVGRSGIKTVAAVPNEACLGGGSLPTEKIPTWCVAIAPAQESVDKVAARLRNGQPAVMARVQNDQILFDMRTVFPAEDHKLVEQIRVVFGEAD